MRRVFCLIAVFGLLLSGCTKIKLTEKDAFDVKRTIDAQWFRDRSYEFESVTFISGDSLELNGWLIQHPQARGTVLYCGGNGFVMVTSYHIIRSIIEQRVNLLVFDYRGYGENPGEPSIAGLQQDAIGAYEFLTGERNISPDSLVIHGHSLGSYTAAFLADSKPSKGLVLECPVTDAKDWTSRLLPWFLKPFVQFDIDSSLLESSNTKRIAKMQLPLLIIAGEDDQVTPASMAESLYGISSSEQKELVIIENSGHNDLPQKQEYSRALDRFYAKVFDSKDL
ncbi:MAG: alpha/beta hydrolase [candidate division KSB1 bacterium]|nr:alpha/beta hydrolase [candidate division KSB1 bacterium]